MRLILIVLALVLISGPASGALINRVVAVVNGEVITKSDLIAFARRIAVFSGVDLASIDQETEDEIINQALGGLIEDMLILSHAKRSGIMVDNQEVEKRIFLVKSNFSNEMDFLSSLDSDGLTYESLWQKIRNDILKGRTVDYFVRRGIEVHPQELKDYYNNNKDKFILPERIKVRKIYIKKGQDSDTKIKQIYGLLQKNVSFEDLVQNHTESVDNEGEWLEKGKSIKEIEDSVFILKLDQISPVIETGNGYYVFKVLEKSGESLEGFDSVKDKIYAYLYQDKLNKRLSDFIADLKKNAQIDIKM